MFFPAFTVPVARPVLDEFVTLVREALRLSDISAEKACLWMQIDKNQWRRQLEGEGHISLTRLMLLPDVFWRWFFLLGAEKVGVPACVAQAMSVCASLAARDERRSA